MNLSPREKDKLMIAVAAMVATDRKNRGVKLNHPESIALSLIAFASDPNIRTSKQSFLRLLPKYTFSLSFFIFFNFCS